MGPLRNFSPGKYERRPSVALGFSTRGFSDFGNESIFGLGKFIILISINNILDGCLLTNSFLFTDEQVGVHPWTGWLSGNDAVHQIPHGLTSSLRPVEWWWSSTSWVARTLGHVNTSMIYKTYGRYIPKASWVGTKWFGFVGRLSKLQLYPEKKIKDSLFKILTEEAKKWVRKYHHLLIGAGISKRGCRLLESLVRHQLISHRPISQLAAIYDGVFVDHPAWFPVEVFATPLAWKYHRNDILKHLLGKQNAKIYSDWSACIWIIFSKIRLGNCIKINLKSAG